VRKPSDESVALYALIFFAFWIFVVLPFLYGQHSECPTEENHGFWQKTACDPIAFFTAWLMGFTAVLAASTIGLWFVTWRSGLKQSRDMKDVIQLTRDEFYSTHRPKIRIKHLWLRSDIWHGEHIAITLTCVNIGTVEARLGVVGIRYEIVSKDMPLPPNPNIDLVHNFKGTRLSCGRNLTIDRIETEPTLTAEQAADIQQGRSQLYCVGYLNYLDNAGRMRITGFCRVLTFPEGFLAHTDNARFRVFNDPDYEYED